MPPYCRFGKILPDSIIPIFKGKILEKRIPAHFLRFPMLSSVYMMFSVFYLFFNRRLRIVGYKSLVTNRWLRIVGCKT